MPRNGNGSPKTGEVRQVAINDIIQDHGTLQVRDIIDTKTVEQYARSMRAGADFPPIKVFKVEGKHYLVDGFHRVAAASAIAEADQKFSPKIRAEVIEGTMGEALKTAALANTLHGKALKRSDHRKSFRMLAQSGALNGMDSRRIADLMNNVVSHVTIWNWAKKDFPDLLEEKPKKGEKPDRNRDRFVDPLSAKEIGQQVVIGGLNQAFRLIDQVTDVDALDEIADTARSILNIAVERGGDPDRNPDPF